MDKTNKKNGKSVKILKNSIYLMRLIYRFSPMLFAFTIIAAIAEFCFTFFNLLFTKRLVQEITDGNEFAVICVTIAVWCIAYLLLRFLIISIDNYFRPVYTKVLIKGLEKYLYDKAAKVDLECYDNSEYYNEFIWATNNSGEMVTGACNSLGAFLGYVLQISGVISMVVLIDPSLSALTFVSVALNIVVASSLEKKKVEYRKEIVGKEKVERYVERVFYLQDSAKDLRLTNIKGVLLETYEKAYQGVQTILKKYVGKIAFVSFLSTFGFRYALNTFVIYGYFAYKLIVKQSIDLSDFVVVNKAMVDLYLLLNRWSGQINALYRNAVYVDTMKKFINYEPHIKSEADAKRIPDAEELILEFRNVTFTYPGNDQPTLRNVSFKINPRNTLAVVGYNGAGKTTLVKLMMRLYDVDQGEILLNGRNIKEFDLEDYRAMFSSVFQDFNLYALSLAENVKMNDNDVLTDDEIVSALKHADFGGKLSTLKDGINSQITREFDEEGLLLSGGEKQKVAMARVFAGTGKIIVFDEPSAALDPFAEYNINKRIIESSQKKSVVLISHRLTATRMADHIIMLENGEVVESGRHEELMQLDGKYAFMYKVQAEPYLKKA
ncbi:MAG: ABC transporter ATP-binding protein/permease [Acetatifactor sp.]|nr:ABC transporter ATP-binding protein/permease [Acetatifactor sp.]